MPKIKDILSLRNLKTMGRFFKQTKFNNGCVEWTNKPTDSGYGTLSIKSASYLTHRLSWVWANNQNVPDDKVICHTCDNRLCVNPEHLWLGTPIDNYVDSVQKGRNRLYKGHKNSHGPNNPKYKCKPEIVREIRRLKALGEHTKVVCRMFNLNQTTVDDIAARRIWKDI